jgi:hypothetical protein
LLEIESTFIAVKLVLSSESETTVASSSELICWTFDYYLVCFDARELCWAITSWGLTCETILRPSGDGEAPSFFRSLIWFAGMIILLPLKARVGETFEFIIYWSPSFTMLL